MMEIDEEKVLTNLEKRTGSKSEDTTVAKEEGKKSSIRQKIRESLFLTCILLVVVTNFFVFGCSDKELPVSESGYGVIATVLAFACIDNWAGIIAVAIFELLLLMVIGRILDIKDIERLINSILASLARNNSDSNS